MQHIRRATSSPGHYLIFRPEIIEDFETLNVLTCSLCKKKGCLTGGILSEFLLDTAFLGKDVKGR